MAGNSQLTFLQPSLCILHLRVCALKPKQDGVLHLFSLSFPAPPWESLGGCLFLKHSFLVILLLHLMEAVST